jgi:hypothetical protein
LHDGESGVHVLFVQMPLQQSVLVAHGPLSFPHVAIWHAPLTQLPEQQSPFPPHDFPSVVHAPPSPLQPFTFAHASPLSGPSTPLPSTPPSPLSPLLPHDALPMATHAAAAHSKVTSKALFMTASKTSLYGVKSHL